MTLEAQPARAANVAAIVDFYESGIKPEAELLGIELEHILTKADGAPVSYSEPYGVKWLLEQLRTEYPQATYDADDDLIGVAREGGAVTIEPAAQLELSAGPFCKLADAKATFCTFEDEVRRIIAPHGMQLHAIGYHPTMRAADLELIPKQRYDFMNRYLGAIGNFGIAMMRGSAAAQISLDYTSVGDCLRKMRIAYALVPLFALMCDSATAFEGAPRTHQMVRTEIWEFCDPDRCGTVPGIMEPGFTLERYAEYILDTPAIVALDADGVPSYDERTFGEIFADTPMTRANVEHALSMFFNDVRLKTYIEIRPADSMPVPYVIAYAALIKGLFYCEASLDALDRLFAGVTAADIEAAKASLMEHGYRGSAYGRPVADLADELMRLGEAGLEELDASEVPLLAPLGELVAARETLAARAETRVS